jgi:hypothetical protein
MPEFPSVPAGLLPGPGSLVDLIGAIPLPALEAPHGPNAARLVVVARAGDRPLVVVSQMGGSVKLDVDGNPATGKNGNDLQVFVTVVRPPSPELKVTFKRLADNVPADVKVLAVLPLEAIQAEGDLLLGRANLFVGYQTVAADGSRGGQTPGELAVRFRPTSLAGSTHRFDVEVETMDAPNPVRHLAGFFGGDRVEGVLDATAFAVLPSPALASFRLGLFVSESGLEGLAPNRGELGLEWAGSVASKVAFDYVEHEAGLPAGQPDVQTRLVVDPMPTVATLSAIYDESVPDRPLQLRLGSSAPIGRMMFVKQRNDHGEGLVTTAFVATDVPTEVVLATDLKQGLVLDVNANTLDLGLVATSEKGFARSAGVLFNGSVKSLAAGLVDAVDLSASFSDSPAEVRAAALKAGEQIGALELVLSSTLAPRLPGVWTSAPGTHVVAFLDDGADGTAAARLAAVGRATVRYLDPPESAGWSAAAQLELGAAAPGQVEVALSASARQARGRETTAACSLGLPVGLLDLAVQEAPLMFRYATTPPTGMAGLRCAGVVGTRTFALALNRLPPFLAVANDPPEALEVRAQRDEVTPNSGELESLAFESHDESGPGLPHTERLFGVPLREIQMRIEGVPSFGAAWPTVAGRKAFSLVAGVPEATDVAVGQVALSAGLNRAGTSVVEQLATAGADTSHYFGYTDATPLSPPGQPRLRRLLVGLTGIRKARFSAGTSSGPTVVQLSATGSNRLRAEVDADFGNVLSPDLDLDLTLEVQPVGQAFAFDTRLGSGLEMTGTEAVDLLELKGHVDETPTTPPSMDATHVDLRLEGLPAAARLETAAGNGTGRVALTASGPTALAALEQWNPAALSPDEAAPATRYRRVELAGIPAAWSAQWASRADRTRVDFATGGTLGGVRLRLSDALPAALQTHGSSNPTMEQLAQPFFDGDGQVLYTNWLRSVDRNWLRLGSGGPDLREALLADPLQELYTYQVVNWAGMDRLYYRPDGAGGEYLDAWIDDVKGGWLELRKEGETQVVDLYLDRDDVHGLSVAQREAADGTLLRVNLGRVRRRVGVRVKSQTQRTFIANDRFDPPLVSGITYQIGELDLSTEEGLGDVWLYRGPAGRPVDTYRSSLTKVHLVDAPTSLSASWKFGGADNERLGKHGELHLRSPVSQAKAWILSQSGDDRMLLALRTSDLDIDYLLRLKPTPVPYCNLLGEGAIQDLVISASSDSGVDALIQGYSFDDSVLSANGNAPYQAGEYKPVASMILDGLTQMNVYGHLLLCPLSIDPVLVMGTTGGVSLDWWDDNEVIVLVNNVPVSLFGDPAYVDGNTVGILPEILYPWPVRLLPFD